MSKEAVQEALTKHWALDEEAASHLVQSGLSNEQEARILSVSETVESNTDALKQRDIGRAKVGNIFTGEVQAGLAVVGPCSLDARSDYGELFDFMEELQELNPDAVIALRANGAKPRTAGGWTGPFYSTNPEERASVFKTYRQAFRRHIPILTEITQENQLGALAPWLSAVWLGARDMPSTTLRSAVSAVHLPVGVKNGTDGDPQTVKNTINAIRRNSTENEDSGVDLGTIASSHNFNGIPTGILPVGQGNNEVAIIARGYALPEGLSPEARREAALASLSAMCILGTQMNSAVLIDGTHDVPAMFDITRKDADRILPVLKIINEAVLDEQVTDGNRIAGVLAEVSTNIGRTDPNFVLDTERKRKLTKLINETLDLVS